MILHRSRNNTLASQLCNLIILSNVYFIERAGEAFAYAAALFAAHVAAKRHISIKAM